MVRAETGITNVIDGVNTNAGATFITGDTGPFNALIITNGGSVSNGVGIIGNAAAASNNSVLVTGTGSAWTNGGALTLGNSGSANELIISDGGVVVGSSVTVGDQTVGRNNIALVTGSGSLWTNAGALVIGNPGSGNQVIITNGAQVFASAITVGNGAAASNNSLQVGGSGSLLVSSGALTMSGGGASYSQVRIADGGQMFNGAGSIGSNGDSNTVWVTGSGSVWSNTGALRVGDEGSYATLVISNGAAVHSQSPGGTSVNTIGHDSGDHNRVIVTDPGSLWNVPGGVNGSVRVGHGVNSHDNALIITNGGFVSNIRGAIGTSASNNFVIVTGTGSTWSNQSTLVIGENGSSNSLWITDGGVVRSTTGDIGLNSSANNNLVTVTGAGSRWEMSSTLAVGENGSFNKLVISDGALVSDTSGAVGGTATGHSNTVIVTGSGSTWSNSSTLTVGNRSVGNLLVVSNGASVFGGANLLVGALTNGAGEASQGSVVVTGAGSLLQIAGTVNVGSNTAQLAGSRGSGSLLITDGATLDVTSTLRAGANNSGWITNDGGIYQFATATPTINTNSGGNIVLNNGTISIRNSATANVFGNAIGSGSNQLVHITYLGQNAFRLNASSNTTATQNYVFNTGLGATNYSRLELVNNGSLWRSAHLTIGSGGTLLASNATARVAATVTNMGSIQVVNSRMTWASNVVIHGSYRSDPSTNIFLNDVTIGESGSLAGGVGDLFDFKKNLLIHSTNNADFNIAESAVMFSGGGMHTNAITGQDLGDDPSAYDSAFMLQTNFAYGELHLGSVTDQVCFACGNIPAIPSNGLYIGWLDLLGDATLVTNLHAASTINLYYDNTDTRNAYLGGLTYNLTDCDLITAGGLLMPIVPEPSALCLMSLAAFALLHRRARHTNF